MLGLIPGGVVDRLGKLPTENGLKCNLSYYIVRWLKSRTIRLNKGLSRDYSVGYIVVSGCPRLRLINLINRVNTNITVVGRKERYVI